MKNSICALFMALFALLLSTTGVEAQCTKTYASKSGTVLAAGPAKIKFKPEANSVTISVNKTGGRAQTIANIYVNNQYRDKIEFSNGRYTREKSKTISGVKNKNVKVEIINQSVGNKFKYSMKAKGQAGSNLGTGTGNPAPQAKKSVTFDRACKNRVNIKVERREGTARANVFIYHGSIKVDDGILDRNQPRINFSLSNSTNKRYRVEVKNVSVGNRIKFRASATQQ
ncbi:MAG: hypothetical protein AAF985_22020 [Bacteroidota bacterium]